LSLLCFIDLILLICAHAFQDDTYLLTTAGPAFPGLKVQSENRVRIDYKTNADTSGAESSQGPSLSLVLLDSNTEASGPAFLVQIFEAAKLNFEVRSKNTVTVVSANDDECDDNCKANGSCVIESNVSLDLDMELPSWVPFPVAILERRGSKAFQGMLDKDCARLVQRFRSEYLEWSETQDSGGSNEE